MDGPWVSSGLDALCISEQAADAPAGMKQMLPGLPASCCPLRWSLKEGKGVPPETSGGGGEPVSHLL